MPALGMIGAVAAMRTKRDKNTKKAAPKNSSNGMFDSFVERAAKAATSASAATQQGLEATKGNALQGLKAAKGNALQGLEAARDNALSSLEAAKEKLSINNRATTRGAAAMSVATPLRSWAASGKRISATDRETVQLLVDLGIERDHAVKAVKGGTADALVEAALVSADASEGERTPCENTDVPVANASPAVRAASADAAEKRLAASRGRRVGTMDDWRRQRAEHRRGTSTDAPRARILGAQQASAEEEDDLILQHALAESLEADQIRHKRAAMAMDSCCAAALPGEDTAIDFFDVSVVTAKELEYEAFNSECFSQSSCAAAPPSVEAAVPAPQASSVDGTPESENTEMEAAMPAFTPMDKSFLHLASVGTWLRPKPF